MSAKKAPKKLTQKKTVKHDDECCIHEDVMKQISEDHVTMKPRFYFVAGSALVGAGMAGAVLTSIFFTNVTLYKLRYDAVFEYLGFGPEGVQPFFQIFPWLSFSVAVGGLIGGSYLLKQYEIAYRHRYKRLLIAFVTLILTLGFMLEQADVHEHMEKVRPLKVFYEHRSLQPGVVGKVIKVQGPRALIITPDNEQVTLDVSLSPRTIRLRPGSIIRAVGEWENEIFYPQHIMVR